MQDFISMGGYAFYVWGSYAVVFGMTLALWLWTRAQAKARRKELAKLETLSKRER